MTYQAKAAEIAQRKTQSLHDMLTHGVRNVEAMSHEQWDAIRRNLFAPSTDAEEGYMGSIEVIHYENETALFLKDADIGGHVVASFGVYIRTPKEAAQMLADSVRNYTLNSLRYGDYGADIGRSMAAGIGANIKV